MKKHNVKSQQLAILFAMAVFGLAIAAVPAWAQSAVPHATREAAASPVFAFRLAHPIAHNPTASPPSCFESGSGLNIIHNFTQEENPETFQVGVVIDNVGNLYGRASGGDNGYGWTYKLALKNQGWMLTPLYSFTGGYNGEYPSTPIVGPEGASLRRGGGWNPELHLRLLWPGLQPEALTNRLSYGVVRLGGDRALSVYRE